MSDWYPWIVFVHVLAAFAFVLSHGVSAYAALQMRADRRREQVAAMLDLSGTSLSLMYVALLVLLVAGIAAGFIGNWWGRLWIWLALGILVAVSIFMYLAGTRFYIQVRHAVGKSAPQDPKDNPPPEPVSAEELAVLLESRHPFVLAAVGGAGLVAIVFLMMLKPF